MLLFKNHTIYIFKCTGVSVICKQHDLQKLIVYNIVLVKVVLSISSEGFLQDLLSYITSSAMYHMCMTKYILLYLV